MQSRPGGGSLADLRLANRNTALRLLRIHGGMTQAEMSRLSGLSPASVSNIVRELTAEGLARITVVTRNGRRASRVTLNPDSGLVVGVDFGNRHLRVALADMAHTVLAEEHVVLAYGHGAEAGVTRCVAMVQDLLRRGGHSAEHLVGMAVGLPGPIMEGTRRLGSSTILPGWADFDVAATFHSALGVPVAVDNDANLGALAESLFGRGHGVRNFAYLKVSTGIGAGLVLNGQLYRGAAGTAGEIGHTTIEEDGPVCRCGNRGCLEMMAAAPALLGLLRDSYGADLSLEDMLRLSAEGDVGCRRVIADAGRHIGVAVANLCNLLSPELVIVGGELAMAGDVLLSSMRESIARRTLAVAGGSTHVVAGALAERTVVLGAVALALHENDGEAGLPPWRAALPALSPVVTATVAT